MSSRIVVDPLVAGLFCPAWGCSAPLELGCSSGFRCPTGAAEAPAGQPQSARLTLTVPGAPVTVTVDLTARPADEATLVTADAQIESTVPLMGPLVESAVEPVVRAQLREKLDQLVDLG